MIGPFNAHHDGEGNTKVKIGVGGQECYDEGPSVLLTIYEEGQRPLEISIPFDQAGQLSSLIESRRQSWSRNRLEPMVVELDLSGRTWACLRKAGIYYIGDLLKQRPSDLMSIRGFGEGCLKEVQERLAEIDLQLRDDNAPYAPPAGPCPRR